MSLKDFFDYIKNKRFLNTDADHITEDAAEDSPEAVDEVDAEIGEDAVLYTEAELIIDDRELFAASLDSLTADDIAPCDESRKSSRFSKRDLVRYAVMLVCACVFIGSAGSLVSRLIDYRRGDAVYGDIADNIFSGDLGPEHAVSPALKLSQSPAMLDYYSSLTLDESDVPGDDTVQHNAKFEQIKANLNYLKSVNPDIYGYIHIDGTNISFPIVQGEDNEYYLNRAWNGDFLVVGSIYADFRADENIENNRNTVFYGHNMLDGNMFNNVMLFRDEEVFNSKLIEIYTFDGIYTYEPFAIFQTVYTYQYFRMEFMSDEDFVRFCEEMQSNSEHSKDMTFTGEDKIITLSTCTPSDDASSYYVGRIALHAKLVKTET